MIVGVLFIYCWFNHEFSFVWTILLVFYWLLSFCVVLYENISGSEFIGWWQCRRTIFGYSEPGLFNLESMQEMWASIMNSISVRELGSLVVAIVVETEG